MRKNKQIADREPDEILKAPRSFVINRGLTDLHVRELTKDFRRVMEPFTASSLKVHILAILKANIFIIMIKLFIGTQEKHC